jgi:hypothetical protein
MADLRTMLNAAMPKGWDPFDVMELLTKLSPSRT